MTSRLTVSSSVSPISANPAMRAYRVWFRPAYLAVSYTHLDVYKRQDVPGYDKDVYMPECMKDENGKAYAYRDRAGNYYELNFGLSYKE